MLGAHHRRDPLPGHVGHVELGDLAHEREERLVGRLVHVGRRLEHDLRGGDLGRDDVQGRRVSLALARQLR